MEHSEVQLRADPLTLVDLLAKQGCEIHKGNREVETTHRTKN